MLKNILKLEGAQQLNKAEQRNIQGGLGPSTGGPFSGCTNNSGCANACSNGAVCTQVFCGPSNFPGFGWDWQCVTNGNNN